MGQNMEKLRPNDIWWHTNDLYNRSAMGNQRSASTHFEYTPLGAPPIEYIPYKSPDPYWLQPLTISCAPWHLLTLITCFWGSWFFSSWFIVLGFPPPVSFQPSLLFCMRLSFVWFWSYVPPPPRFRFFVFRHIQSSISHPKIDWLFP